MHNEMMPVYLMGLLECHLSEQGRFDRSRRLLFFGQRALFTFWPAWIHWFADSSCCQARVCRIYSHRPTPPVISSERGNATQHQFSPMRDKSQNSGIRQKICRVSERHVLARALPMAWKNTGIIRENTAGKKLNAMMRRAVFPICSTAASCENRASKPVGNASKHTMPTSIKAQEIATALRTTHLQRA